MNWRRLLPAAMVACFMARMPAHVLGQAPAPGESRKLEGDEGQEERDERMRLMRAMVEGVKLHRLSKGQPVEVPLVAEPLMHFNDAARRYQDGTLWAFGRQGRPAALTTCFTNDAAQALWWHAITSLSTDRLRADRQGQVVWSPESPGVKFHAFTDAPDLGTTERARLLQLRSLARRFTAHQFWEPKNQRFELRLLARPVHQYRDPDSGLLDGAIFIFTHGTNPELLLLIEAVEKGSSANWQYALVRIGSAEFHAELDGAEVYNEPRAPGVVGRPTDPYCMFRSVPPPIAEIKKQP